MTSENRGVLGDVQVEDRGEEVCARGLAFKAHRRLYHSTLGSRVIKKRRGHKVQRTAWSSARFVRGSSPPSVREEQLGQRILPGARVSDGSLGRPLQGTRWTERPFSTVGRSN